MLFYFDRESDGPIKDVGPTYNKGRLRDPGNEGTCENISRVIE